jgi:hypothetical protein
VISRLVIKAQEKHQVAVTPLSGKTFEDGLQHLSSDVIGFWYNLPSGSTALSFHCKKCLSELTAADAMVKVRSSFELVKQ